MPRWYPFQRRLSLLRDVSFARTLGIALAVMPRRKAPPATPEMELWDMDMGMTPVPLVLAPGIVVHVASV